MTGRWWGAGLLVAGLLGTTIGVADGATPEEVADALRRRLEDGQAEALVVADEPIRAVEVLPAFYERRLYRPAWIDAGGAGPRLEALLSALAAVAGEGLDPESYHRSPLERLVATADSAPAWADVELLATDAFLVLGAHLVSGRVDARTFDPEWRAARREVDLGRVLTEGLERGDPVAALGELRPRSPGYGRLVDALARLRATEAAGGWPVVPGDEPLRPGDAGPRVAALAERLLASGDLREPVADPALFGPALEVAVRSFQERHGLDPDGVVGEKTLAALGPSVVDRIEQIELNLERWRWLPLDLGRRHLLVNVPSFDLRLVEDEEEVLAMKVAVGRSYRRTPVLSDLIRYLVLNPTWDVPRKLAVQDKLPEIKKDPTYLAANGFVVLEGWGAEQQEVDPAAVDWSTVDAASFPYRLRQRPGVRNALGQVKFMFPNEWNVYLHDTPDRKVFERTERDVSSGCIRVERPLELAARLLADQPAWSPEALLAAVATGRERVVTLAVPVPVHLLYWTAWADEDGRLHLRRDVYGRDERLAAALEALDR